MEYVGKLYGKIGGRYIEVDDTEKLREENAALRAAVKEMQRYLPVLEFVENDGIEWDFATAGTGIATLNAYRQTLETALAKMNEK